MQDSDALYIDLGRYVEVLFRQWQLILGAVLVCAVAAAFVTLRQPKTYQARALVVSTKLASSVSFETAITTLSEDENPTSIRFVDPKARLQSYVLLVKNPAIAEVVLEELGERIPADSRDVVSLLSMVQGEVADNSDTLEILVTSADPVLAADIANTWAQAYVDRINAIYSDSGAQGVYESVVEQLDDARAEYAQSQAELESILEENRAAQYERLIDENISLISAITETRTLAVGTVISNTMISQLAVFNQQVGGLAVQLSEVYSDTRKVDRQLLDARNMRDQVRNGGPGAAASNALALMLLKSQVFAGGEGAQNMIVQTVPADLSPQEMVADLDSLIAALEERQAELASRIEALSARLLSVSDESTGRGSAGDNPADNDPAQASLQSFMQMQGLEGVAGLDLAATLMEQKIQELEGNISRFEAGLAHELDREQELTRARDRAWETYDTLATKEAEL
ncbi:MAG TPA: Wzz/FepE/Etk N-terminal domain-containing protein, partial [Anaerolineales bacterium]